MELSTIDIWQSLIAGRRPPTDFRHVNGPMQRLGRAPVGSVPRDIPLEPLAQPYGRGAGFREFSTASAAALRAQEMNSMSTNEKPAVDKSTTPSRIQGEGDYESSRKYRKDTEQFLETADVPDLARKAAPKSKQEAEELNKAEAIGREGDPKGPKG